MQWSAVKCAAAAPAAPGHANNWKATAGRGASEKVGQQPLQPLLSSDQRALVVQIFSSHRAGWWWLGGPWARGNNGFNWLDVLWPSLIYLLSRPGKEFD